jgi:spore maturation protein B
MDALVWAATPLANLVRLPPELLPLAFLRPLSGSGAFALATEMTKTFGPDTYLGQLAATLQGSTETTFYVLAVYFGAVNVSRSRHAVATGLVTDLAGAIAAVAAVRWLIGGP